MKNDEPERTMWAWRYEDRPFASRCVSIGCHVSMRRGLKRAPPHLGAIKTYESGSAVSVELGLAGLPHKQILAFCVRISRREGNLMIMPSCKLRVLLLFKEPAGNFEERAWFFGHLEVGRCDFSSN